MAQGKGGNVDRENKPKAFLVYCGLIDDLIEAGQTAEQIGTLILAMKAYTEGEELPTMDVAVRSVFITRARPFLEESISKYQEKCERLRENGKKGGRPKKPNGFQDSENENQKNQDGFLGYENETKKTKGNKVIKSESNKVITNSGELVKNKSLAKARPLSSAEVKEYRESLGYIGFDAEQFFDHYEANGWVQGKNKPIKDWKARVRNWHKREAEFKPKETAKGESWLDFAIRTGGGT